MKTITANSAQLWQEQSVDDPPILIIDILSKVLTDGIVRITPRIGGVEAPEGNYEEFTLRVSLPDDAEKTSPRIALELSNIDANYIEFLLDNNLSDATVNLNIARKSTPDIIDFTQRFKLESAKVQNYTITLSLSNVGYTNVQAVRLIFGPRVIPTALLGTT